MNHEMNYSALLIMVVILLIAAAIIFPSNHLTGSVINEEPCDDLGCVQLCEQTSDREEGIDITRDDDTRDDDTRDDDTRDDEVTRDDVAQSSCGEEFVCCRTFWQSGVCDYEFNCEKIQSYSLTQSLEEHQESIRENPELVADMRSFFIPLTITIAVFMYFMWKRKKQDYI